MRITVDGHRLLLWDQHAAFLHGGRVILKKLCVPMSPSNRSNMVFTVLSVLGTHHLNHIASETCDLRTSPNNQKPRMNSNPAVALFAKKRRKTTKSTPYLNRRRGTN